MFVHVGKSNFVFLKIPFIVLIFWLTNKESDFLRIFFYEVVDVYTYPH